MKTTIEGCALVCALVTGATAVAGTVRLGSPFGDSIVLQRQKPIPVWGTADAGATVTVSFAGASVSTTAGADGSWRVTLPPQEASTEPRDLAVSGTVLHDVVVGEVWLCSGQSNMEMSFAMGRTRYGDGIGRMVAQVTHKPLIRYMKASGRDGWHRLTPEFLTSGWRSSIPIHYALELHEKLAVPVGVVVAAVGGSNIDSWTPSHGAKAHLHRSLIVPLGPLAMRGALWYQGETNVREVEEYPGKMVELRRTWAEQFGNPAFPLYFVQLAPYRYAKPEQLAALPRFMEAQAKFAETDPHAAITVVNDIGNYSDIHPNNKWLVAKRLALHALKRDYGFPNVEDDSPFPAAATAVSSNVVRVAFNHAESLYVYRPADRGLFAEFELAGVDGVWKKAEIVNFAQLDWTYHGTVSTNFVDLVAKGVDRPVRVRHAYQPPFAGVLFNQVNLPCGPFVLDIGR